MAARKIDLVTTDDQTLANVQSVQDLENPHVFTVVNDSALAVPRCRVMSIDALPTVGLVGVGEMGMPMAQRLTGAGFPLNVFARRPEVIGAAKDLGAHATATLVELAAGSDVVLVCVYSDDQVREVCLGTDGLVDHMRAGSVLCNHTTGRPSTGQALESAGRTRDVDVLDCALSGGPADIMAGDLTLLVGGDRTVLERATPALAAYSSPILHVGSVGDGQKVKLLNNALFGAHVALAARTEACARELDMDPTAVLAAIHECSGDSKALAIAAAMGSAQTLLDAAGRFIRKDVAVCSEVASDLGADLGSILTVAQEV